MTKVTMTSKGQVTIPVAIRAALGFKLGSRIDGMNLAIAKQGAPMLTLEQRLAAFDPEKHGEEVVTFGYIGG